MTDPTQAVADNLQRLRERIAAAAERAGRDSGSVKLVVVTKFVPEPLVRAVLSAGCRDLGESRPQDLWARAAAIDQPDVRWHLVGHLQRNKVRRTLPLADLIHSVDSLRLLEAIAEEARSLARPARLLLEVNISGEAAKHGLAPDEVEPLLARCGELASDAGGAAIEVLGLMGMAPLAGGAAAARPAFARLRELRERLLGRLPPGVRLDELSMGMSGDFDEAIAEGSTIVRIGSALFEGAA
jgi:pyridoxal phosphate enzyme (YggS family)